MKPACKLIAALLLCGTAAFASAAQIDYARSEITFVSTQMNVPVEGRFRTFTATVDFRADRLEASSARLEVDLASVDTGSDEADTEVKRRNWFNVAAFPTARFVSTGLRRLDDGRYEARGTLSIKGITQPVTAPFTVRQDGDATVFEGGFTLSRLRFNIGEGVWSDTDTVADPVQVRFRLTQTANAR